MAKKLKITPLENQFGRPIYEDVDTGKRHSELSTTFKYNGKWINIPTLHRGKIYSPDELKRLLDLDDPALDGWITSTHESKFEAEQEAKKRSDSLKETSAKTASGFFELSEAGHKLVLEDQAKTKKLKDKKLAASVKPVFTYKGDMKPKESVMLLKDVKVDYGPMPGFKRPLDNQGKKQGYYDADEKSEFWKTDAGYEKAMQTWGKDGGVLPQFVKKPEQKEFNMAAIRKLFTFNK